MTVMGYEPSVADIPARIKIRMREKRIKMIFLPMNFLYSAFISDLIVRVPGIVSVLSVIFVHSQTSFILPKVILHNHTDQQGTFQTSFPYYHILFILSFILFFYLHSCYRKYH